MSRKKNHVALFAGLGGFITAGNRAGFETVYANDNDPFCCETLKATFPNLRISQTDVRQISVQNEFSQIDEIDLLSAGFPCQSFSNAGENKGFDDDRGKLFFEIIRLCKELNNPPKVIILENVPFMKIFDNGSRLSTVLQHLRSAGYWVSERQAMIINSKDFCGSAQNRERLFIVAYHSRYFKKNYFDLNPISDPDHVSLWKIIDRSSKVGSAYYLNSESKYWDMINKAANGKGEDHLFQVRRTKIRACPENTCPTLTANMGGGGHNVPFLFDKFGIRRLTESECLKLQGYENGEVVFPDHFPKTVKYSMIGNAIFPGVAEALMKKIDYSRVKGKKNDRMELPAQ